MMDRYCRMQVMESEKGEGERLFWERRKGNYRVEIRPSVEASRP